MGKYADKAREIKPYYQKGAQSLTDQEALNVKGIYPAWDELVNLGSIEAEAGYKFTYGKDLYSCRDENPKFQADWIPGEGTEALYARIDEEHAGTLEDPIPYSGNMALEAGKYYSQDGVTYVCTRDTGNPVYHPLAELEGLYVEAV